EVVSHPPGPRHPELDRRVRRHGDPSRGRGLRWRAAPGYTGSDSAAEARETPSARATGTAVSPYRTTVPTITRNVAGRSLSAPSTPDEASCGAKLAAVEAATIPRGSIHPTKARSFRGRSVRTVDTIATTGRTTSTRQA